MGGAGASAAEVLWGAWGELSCSREGTGKSTPVWTDFSVFWSPGRKQPWSKDLLQSLPAGGLANYVPGYSLAMRADAVIEFDLCPPCPLYRLHESTSLSPTAHQGHNILFREAESQPCPQPEDMWLISLIRCGFLVCKLKRDLHLSGVNISLVGTHGGWLSPEAAGGKVQRILIQRGRRPNTDTV